MDTSKWHRLTNVDLENKRADCSICGPDIEIQLRTHQGKIVKRQCFSPASPHFLRDQARVARRYERRRGRSAGVSLIATSEELATALEAQGGRCAICQEERKLVPDHDHATGKFRGWLCSNCNVGLGMLGDDMKALQEAIAYLQRSLLSPDRSGPT